MDNLRASLPGWEIVRCIGSGSSGKVYELKKKDEYGGDFHAALKVISVPGSQKEYDEMLSTMSEFAMRAKLREKVEEISSEYRLLGALRGHPNIVNCEDQMIIPHDNDMGWDIYIRMELLTSLPDYVREHGMSVSDVVKLGTDMCSALEQCRENNIIHRDIKPQNIFVSRYGDFKLGDFGVAKASTIRSSADKVGTYSYMAPEVYKGKSYDDRVDIYSLGMVLYWLLNERRGPFLPMPPQSPTAEQTADAQLRRFRGEALPPPKNGSGALKKLVQKACSFRAEERFASPAEMKKALSLAASGKTRADVADDDATVREDAPVRIPEQRPIYEPKPEQKAKPKTAPPPKKPEPKPRKQEEPKEKPIPVYIIALVLIIIAMIAAVVVFLSSGRGGHNTDQPKNTETPAPTETAEPEKLEVSAIVLSSPRLTLTEQEEAKLNVSCIPEPKAGQKEPEYIWKSSDTSVVSVDGSGNVKALSEGAATVMVYVKDKMEVYDECMVIVEKPYVTELIIEEMPVKTVYSVGETLDTTGLVLRAYYNNGDAKRITNPDEYTAECDMSGLGNREATVTFEGKTVTYTVRISLFG